MQSAGDRPRRPRHSGSARSRSHSRTRRPSLTRTTSSSQSIQLVGGFQPHSRKNSASSYKSDEEHSEANDTLDYDIPVVTAPLDHTLPQEYFKQDLLNIIKNLRISKWHKLPISVANDIQIKRLSGALTNAIYKIDSPSVVILKNHDLHNIVFPSLLLRIYGANAESFIDRNYELKVLVRLSRKNIGARLLGIFKNGRIEQYLENAITLTKRDIMNKKTSARIARRMKELHIGISLTSKEREQGPSSLRHIRNWFNQVEEWINAGKLTKLDQDDILKSNFNTLKEASLKYESWVSSKYKDINKDLVFCHNDTQYGNLLFSTSPKQKTIPPTTVEPRQSSNTIAQSAASAASSIVTSLSNLSLENLSEQIKPTIQEKKQDQNLVVIDFEYSGPNLPAFDISNHFCEWMHNYNHPTKAYAITVADYPNIEEQLNLIYSYVLFPSDFKKSTDLEKLDKQAKVLFNEIIYWRPAVNLLWALWAILQNGPDGSKAEEIIEQGPNGEQYKIIIDNDENSEESDEEIVVEEQEGSSDVDNFEYLKYARDKLEVFWGDLIQLKIIDEDDKKQLKNVDNLKYLNAEFYDF